MGLGRGIGNIGIWLGRVAGGFSHGLRPHDMRACGAFRGFKAHQSKLTAKAPSFAVGGKGVFLRSEKITSHSSPFWVLSCGKPRFSPLGNTEGVGTVGLE
jgi:hypothetical protein